VSLRRAIFAVALAAACPAMADDDTASVVFASWNLRHFRLEPVPEGDGQAGVPAKSPASIEAIVRTLAAVGPDILGLCEIGSHRDLEHLQEGLARAGVSLPHGTLVEAEDPHRRLALLSRFPLREIDHETTATLIADGVPRRVQRGFLDCTVEVRPHFSLRVLGAHLKSRRIVPDFDQEEVRRAESHLLRRRVENVLGGAPSTQMLVFGDFNDTKNSPVVRGLLGRQGAKDALTLLSLADEVGDQWTYHWAETDEYSRIDFVMVSNSLRPLVDLRASRVHRVAGWREASDHRPLVVSLKIPPSASSP
jgi:endonuclease/exonuclease/phosphatase family metal-dependent hydrolase